MNPACARSVSACQAQQVFSMLMVAKLFLSLIDSCNNSASSSRREDGRENDENTLSKKEIITTSPVSEALFLDLHKGYKHPLILIEKLPFAPFHVPFHRLNGHSPKDAERHE